MTYFFISLFYFIALLYLLAPSVNAASTFSQLLSQSPQQPLEQHFDIQYITTIIEQNQERFIQETEIPELHTNSHNKKKSTTMNHSTPLTKSATVQVCKKIGGEKLASACAYVVNARPWKKWQQKVSRSIYGVNSWHAPMAINYIIKTIGHPSVDAFHAVHIMLDNWWTLPFFGMAHFEV
jgi:hypothetical protein